MRAFYEYRQCGVAQWIRGPGRSRLVIRAKSSHAVPFLYESKFLYAIILAKIVFYELLFERAIRWPGK